MTAGRSPRRAANLFSIAENELEEESRQSRFSSRPGRKEHCAQSRSASFEHKRELSTHSDAVNEGHAQSGRVVGKRIVEEDELGLEQDLGLRLRALALETVDLSLDESGELRCPSARGETKERRGKDSLSSAQSAESGDEVLETAGGVIHYASLDVVDARSVDLEDIGELEEGIRGESRRVDVELDGGLALNGSFSDLLLDSCPVGFAAPAVREKSAPGSDTTLAASHSLQQVDHVRRFLIRFSGEQRQILLVGVFEVGEQSALEELRLASLAPEVSDPEEGPFFDHEISLGVD